MNNLEDLIADEIERQGFRTTPDTFREMLIGCIGRMIDSGAILLPSGAISLPDYIRSHVAARPDQFTTKAAQEASGHSSKFAGLTAAMIEENQRAKSAPLPDRGRYHGLTRQMMDELATARQR
jgi:hypothetical protein